MGIVIRDDYVTVTQSMEAFHVTRPTILRWIHKGRLRGCKFIGNKWLIPEHSINRFLNSKFIKDKVKKPINHLYRLDNWFMELKRSYHPRRVNNQLQTAYNLFIRSMRRVSVGKAGIDVFNVQIEQQLVFYHSIEKLRDSYKWLNNDGKYLPGFGNFIHYVLWQQKEDPSTLRAYLKKKDAECSETVDDCLPESQHDLYDIKL